MGLDDILRLLALLFFVVIPIFRSISRRLQKIQSPQPPAQSQGKPSNSESTNSERSKPVSTVSTSTASTTTISSDFEKKLIEARRKVQEAMQQQGGLIKPESSKDIGQESAEGLFQPQKPKLLGGQLPSEMHGFPTPKDLHGSTIPAEFHQKATIVGGSIPETSHTSLTVAQSLQKTTFKRPKQAKLNKRILLSKDMLSEQELTRGLLWQQILSEPRSKQKRRNLSQHRLP